MMITKGSLTAIAAALHASASIALAQIPAGYRWDVPPVPPPSISYVRPTPAPRELAPADAPPVPRVESSRRNAAARNVSPPALGPASPFPDASAEADSPSSLPADSGVAVATDVPAGVRVAERSAPERASEARRIQDPAGGTLPILSVEATGDEHAQVGMRTTYRIAVRNLGRTVARDVAVDLIVPSGIEVVGTRPARRNADDGRMQFDAGSIPAGAQRVIEIDAVPRRAGAFDFQPSVRIRGISNQAATAVAPAPAALSLEIYAPAAAATGDRVVCRAVVRNSGGTPANDVAILAEFPSTFEAEGDAQRERELGAIGPGASREATFVVTPREAGTMPIAFRAVGAGDLATEIAGEMTVLRRDLTLEIEGPAVLPSQRSGVFRVSLKNTGEAPLREVILRCGIPEGLNVEAIDRQARYEPHERVLTLTVPEIAAGAAEVLQIAAAAGVVGPQTITATAHADGLTPTSVIYDAEVAGHVDLSMTLATVQGPAALEEPATIAVKLVNRGSEVARKVKLRLLLPEDIDAVSADGETSQEVVVPAFELNPGEERTALFTLRGRTAGDHLVQAILNSETLDRGLLQETSVRFYEAARKRVASRP